MFRLSANRWMAFVLTLCLFTTCFFLLAAWAPSVASAEQIGSYLPTDETPGGLPSLGDPDVPMGPGDGKAGSSRVVRSGSNQLVSQSGARPAGIGTVPVGGVLDQLRLSLLSLRSLFLRF